MKRGSRKGKKGNRGQIYSHKTLERIYNHEKIVGFIGVVKRGREDNGY